MSQSATPDPPLPFGPTESTRLMLVLLGAALLVGALVAPWWTRGMNVDEQKLYDPDQGDSGISFFLPPGSEGLYFNYGAFHTPSSGGISYDSGRETATAVLGIALVACAVFAAAALAVRWLMARGTIELSFDAPVRLAICAFVAGVFAVLWGAFFVPLAGDNPGMLYGDEPSEDAFADSDGIAEATRYANAGFFLGIAGAVLFPAYLWFDAARVRAFHTYGWSAGQDPATDAPTA